MFSQRDRNKKLHSHLGRGLKGCGRKCLGDCMRGSVASKRSLTWSKCCQVLLSSYGQGTMCQGIKSRTLLERLVKYFFCF